MASMQELIIGAAVVGIASHLGYFIHGEHHLQGPFYFQIASVVPIVAIAALNRATGMSLADAFRTVALAASGFYTGLFGSMTVYRSFFHPLRKFPGPTFAKVSKFWHILQLGGCDNYKRLDRWNKEYGSFVRIGPSELALFEPDAVEATMGSRSACTKAPWYDISAPLISLHNARDRAQHDKRRKVWDRGFNTKALDSYESRVTGFADVLMSKIRAAKGQAMNMSLWFNYYSFDVMGELSFGKSFDMLQNEEKHPVINYLHGGSKPVGILSPMPWIMILFIKIPYLAAEFQHWISFCAKQAQERKNMEVANRDIMSYILEAEPMSSDPSTNELWLTGDSRLIIVAGSDTTAATLTHLFYHLAKDPKLVEELRKEIDPLKSDGAVPFTAKSLQDAKYLKGAIHETLRLHPPVPSGVSRVTPPEGLNIKGTYVPGNTIVSVPLWSLGHSEAAYKQPLEFIPERWSSKPELILHEGAFAPFSIGRYGCVGKNLAMMELRVVAANIVSEFDVSFAPGEDGSRLINDSQDYFTIGLAPLELKLTPRK